MRGLSDGQNRTTMRNTNTIPVLILAATTTPWCSQLSAQELTWARQFASPDQMFTQALALDPAGNAYTTGLFHGTIDFDPGPNAFNLTSAGVADVFVCKLSANGDFLWAVRFGGTEDEQGRSITVDAAGSAYITGEFHDVVDFDPGPGAFPLSANTAGGVPSAGFVCKLMADGSFAWACKLGSSVSSPGGGNAIGYDVALDPAGTTLAVSGTFTDTLITSPGNPVMLICASPVYNGFAITFNATTGDAITGGSLEGFSNSGCTAVAMDGAGGLYLGGTFSSITDFDPGISVHEVNSLMGMDGFILKWTGNTLDWVRTLHGTFGDAAVNDLCLDTGGNVLCTGQFNDVFDFSGVALTAVGIDAYVVKFDSGGGLQWVAQMGSPQGVEGKGIDTDAAGNVYSTGYYGVSADMDPGPNTFLLSVGTNAAVPYVQKLDQNGQLDWAVDLEGPTGAVGRGIAMHSSGAIYSVGDFRGTIDFDPQAGSFPLTAELLDNGYVHRMCEQHELLVAVGSCGPYTTPAGNVYDVTGLYTENLVSAAGCDSVVNYSVTITTYDTTVTASGDMLTAALAGMEYAWLDCDNGFAQVPGANGQDFAPAISGHYALSVGVSGGCWDTSYCHTVVITGLADLPGSQGISAAPVPTSGPLVLELGRPYGQAVVTVLDGAGRSVQRIVALAATRIPMTLDVPPGLYMLRVALDDGHVERLRVMKE